jgi:hypothetical protein
MIDGHNVSTGYTGTYTFTEVNLQPPSPKLFERPADCKQPKAGKPLLDMRTKPGSSKPAANTAPAPAKEAPAPPQ